MTDLCHHWQRQNQGLGKFLTLGDDWVLQSAVSRMTSPAAQSGMLHLDQRQGVWEQFQIEYLVPKYFRLVLTLFTYTV